MVYGTDRLVAKKALEKSWMRPKRECSYGCVNAKLDRIMNERVSETTKVGKIAKKVQESDKCVSK